MTVEVLKAQYRQLSHERARLMAAMAQIGCCGVASAEDELRRLAVPDEFAADEVRAALVLTRRAAQVQFWPAHDLLTRLLRCTPRWTPRRWMSPARGCSRSGPPSCARRPPARCAPSCCPGRRG
ncbi:MAG: hypothetical protein JO063_12605 [Pseudonocardiales bacterium]|nr:hypothetical protein [Pseudonocardiales bacterium]MBV9032782.1 hypothetical protein [Pseudonocardiales bacterium]MBW0010931.1 hypothetical protein [Pseudonocardiales bacterium]